MTVNCNPVVFREIFPVTVNTNAETLLANGVTSAGALFVQNNSKFEANVLIWAKANKSDKPDIYALRAGGSLSIETPVAAFEVWGSLFNPLALYIQPPGYTGGYEGPGRVKSNQVTYGYVKVTAWAEHVNVQVREGDMQRIDYNSRPPSNWTNLNYLGMNYYDFQGNMVSTLATIGTTKNTLEQIVAWEVWVHSPIALAIEVAANGNLGNADLEVSFSKTITVEPGERVLLDMSAYKLLPLNINTNPACPYGLPQGTTFQVGSQAVNYTGAGWAPTAEVSIVTAVLEE